MRRAPKFRESFDVNIGIVLKENVEGAEQIDSPHSEDLALKEKRTMKVTTTITWVVATLILVTVSYSRACTRALWNTNKLAVLAGRSMDWPESTQPVLTVLPEGMARNGGLLGPIPVIKENGLKWKSKYGSIVTTVYGLGTADGLNERGLAAHMLFF